MFNHPASSYSALLRSSTQTLLLQEAGTSMSTPILQMPHPPRVVQQASTKTGPGQARPATWLKWERLQGQRKQLEWGHLRGRTGSGGLGTEGVGSRQSSLGLVRRNHHRREWMILSPREGPCCR